ncbi:MAG: hypothetical protein IJ588_14955 [Prevotella sp.]|nr:hypothetical protein [Prevotella sp.]MBR1450026.1 hypothetical protein [Prevotella sp.]
MNSKSWQSFDSRLKALKQHLQLSDLALTLANKKAAGLAGNGQKIAEVLGGSLDTHMQLNIPNEKRDISRAFITSRNKLHEQAIIELYGEFSNYVANVISEIEHKNPMRFLSLLSENSENGIKYKDIITIGNYNALIGEMAKRVFRTLENKRSTKDLLAAFIRNTSITIDNEILEKALVYLEIRHLIIHNNTKADAKFKGMARHDIVSINQRNQKINLNFTVTNEAINAIFRLCKKIDDEIVDKDLI